MPKTGKLVVFLFKVIQGQQPFNLIANRKHICSKSSRNYSNSNKTVDNNYSNKLEQFINVDKLILNSNLDRTNVNI